MTRRIFGKVMWLGRATSSVVGLAILLALAIGATNSALAHTNVDNKLFHLGHANRVGTATTPGTPTSLVSTLSDAVKSALVVRNNSGGPALSLGVLTGKAPLTVNPSAGTATNLSADEFDGKDSDEFVQNTGEMTFSVFDSWMSSHSPSNPVTVDYRGSWTTFTRGAGGQTQSEVRLAPPLPSSLYGKSLLLTGMEICYDTSNPAVAPSRVKLDRFTNGGGTFVVDDNAPTDGNQCRTYRGTPQLMGTNSHAFLEMYVNWSETTSETSFVIQRTTFFLEPSNTAAAAL